MNFPKIQFTGGIIWILEKVFGREEMESKHAQLRTLDKGTVGREVADMLDAKGYTLIPKFENHDLKHVILDYEMFMKDEIRMQAYLVGNGNYSSPCLIFLGLAFFYPSIWRELPEHYRQGKKSKSIYFLCLDNCAQLDLIAIKSEYGRRWYTAD